MANLDSNSQAALIGGSFSAGSGLLGGLFGLIGQGIQNKHNREMAKLQNQYNLDMWNMQNEYNDPSAQMARLKNAGLNPNLAYGEVTTGNAQSAPQQVAPVQNAPDLTAFAPNPKDMMQMINGLEVLKGVALDNQSKRLRNEMLEGEVASMHMFDNMDIDYDPSVGRFMFNPLPANEVNVYKYPSAFYRWKNAWSHNANAMNLGTKWLNGVANRDLLGTRNKLLQKDLEWYNTDMISGMIFKGLQAVAPWIVPFFPKKTLNRREIVYTPRR